MTSPALRYLGASRLADADGVALAVLARAGRCPSCARLLAQRFERLGSTLFYDDDPRQLLRAFAPEDQDDCALCLLAACIVLYGRTREPVPAVH